MPFMTECSVNFLLKN